MTLDEVAQRHGYFAALVAAGSGSGSVTLDDVAQRQGYYRALIAATTGGADALAQANATRE